MQTFTGWQYLLIDLANHWGLDKVVFEERIKWATENLTDLEKLAEDRGQWKEKPLYLKTCLAIRKAQRGEATGHLVGFDAVCSGMQLMSAMTGCIDGANATGLVDPNRRADAYTDCTALMNGYLHQQGSQVDAPRESVKNAVMTSLYGSKKEPENEFGKDTAELEAFHKSMADLAPGPVQLLSVLLASWQANALSHDWQMPDGFEVKCPVTRMKETKIQVDELGGVTFKYVWKENEGTEKDVKNAAK